MMRSMNDQLRFPGMEWGFASWLYFGARYGFLKIGVTGDPPRRARELGLVLLLVLPGGRQEEAAMHRRFRRSRIGHEWYLPTPELLAFVASRGGTAPDGWPWTCDSAA